VAEGIPTKDLAEWAQVVQAGIALLGIGFIIYQIYHLRESIRHLRDSIYGTTQDSLYAHYMEINKLFMEHPHLRPYFYANARKPQPDKQTIAPGSTITNETVVQQIDFMSEAILGLVEHAVLQQQNVPEDAWTHCWRPYAIERVERSEALSGFFDPNAHWYTSKMREEMKSIKWQAEENKKRARANQSSNS
jgi:hypothetical protein